MLYAWLVALRCLNALLLQTAFAPDEYWQSLEVAHRLAFGCAPPVPARRACCVRAWQGVACRLAAAAPHPCTRGMPLTCRYGHLTWEWVAGLRSYVHPGAFAALYWLLGQLGLDSAWAVRKGPLLLQALCAAAADLYVCKTAELLFDGPAARWGDPGASARPGLQPPIVPPQARWRRWALLCQLASWFNAYCLPRTYSNSVEAALVAAGVYHWLRARSPREGAPSTAARDAARARTSQRAWLLAAAVSCVVRPPSALFWLLPALLELRRRAGRARLRLAVEGCAAACSCLGAAALVDRAAYGRCAPG